VRAPTRRRYFETTTICAPSATADEMSSESPAITTRSKRSATPCTQSNCFNA
jgi:hypothetical protein